MIKSLLRWSVITAFSGDDKDFPTHQVTYIGKNADALSWYPYGFHANPGAGALALMIAVNGDPENRVVFPGSPKERGGTLLPTPLNPGEVLVYNPTTQSFIHMKLDGGIDIEATISDINIKSSAGNVNVDAINAVVTTTGITRIVAVGAVDIDAGAAVTIDSVGPTTITGTGTVTIDGNTLVDLLGTLVEGSDGGATKFLCNEAFLALFNAHIHSTPSSGNTNAPTTTAVVGTDTTTVLKGE
jgi:phage gp45-like